MDASSRGNPREKSRNRFPTKNERFAQVLDSTSDFTHLHVKQGRVLSANAVLGLTALLQQQQDATNHVLLLLHFEVFIVFHLDKGDRVIPAAV